MKNLKILIVFALIGVIPGCSPNESQEDCLEKILTEFEMVEYQGQEIGCNFFLELYTFLNKDYYVLNSYCADLISYPTDCDGNRLCENGEGLACNAFYDFAERVGIVGITE